MLVPICKTPHATTRPFTVWHAWPRAMQIGHDRSAGIALRRCCKRTTPQPAVAEATPLPDECYKVPIQKRDFPIDTILGWVRIKL